MEIPLNPSAPGKIESLRLEAVSGSSQGLLQRLQQLGSFRARVVQAEGTRVLLDTAFGQLRGEPGPSPSSSLRTRLQPGDIIEARLQLSDNRPLLSILEHRPLQQAIRQPELYRQLQQAPHALLAGRVLQNETGQRLLAVGREQYPLPRDTRLQPGDTVLLRPGKASGEIRMQRIQPRPLLLQALSRLLPRQAGGGDSASGGSLPRLQQLLSRILPTATPGANRASPNPDPDPDHQAPGNAAPARATAAAAPAESVPAGASNRVPGRPAIPGTPPAMPQPASPDGSKDAARAVDTGRPAAPSAPEAARDTPPRPGGSQSPEPTGQRLQSMLQPLLKLGLSPQRLTPEQLQNSLAQLGLMRSPAPAPGAAPPAGDLLPRLIELQTLLRDQPELFERLFHARTPPASAAAHGRDSGPAEDWPQWRQQFSQQLEQGINQLMLGKTGLRLQQDQQQPLNLNLVLPLQLPEQPPRELKLRLQQRPDAENPEQPAWDVRLSFEFGLLGLITVHVLLQESRISAHFWAVEETTWRMIDRELPSFRKQLQRNGFTLGLFDCFLGQPKSDQPEPPTAGDGNLLDVEA